MFQSKDQIVYHLQWKKTNISGCFATKSKSIGWEFICIIITTMIIPLISLKTSRNLLGNGFRALGLFRIFEMNGVDALLSTGRRNFDCGLIKTCF